MPFGTNPVIADLPVVGTSLAGRRPHMGNFSAMRSWPGWHNWLKVICDSPERQGEGPFRRPPDPVSRGMSDASSRSKPSVAEIFLGFFTIGVCGFGGVLPWARRTILETRKWLTPAEFTELLGFCQFMPGGNIMNVAVALGSRFQGIPGAVAALVGLMAAPVTIVIGLGAVYDQYKDVPSVKHAFMALAAAGAGMLIATSFKIAAPLKGRWIAIFMTVVTFAAIAVLRLPLVIVMPIMAVLSTLVLWRFAR